MLIELNMYCVNWMFCCPRSAKGAPAASIHMITFMYLICIVLIKPNPSTFFPYRFFSTIQPFSTCRMLPLCSVSM